ncbi:MAG: hypothetical protein IH986_09125 [Planctomycetes bacterium]|nr:hypothetical protein [Planctomycetota bacterium]
MNQILTKRSMLAALVALFSVSAFAAASILPDQKAPPGDVVVVEAEGEGLSKDEAVKAALRSALEQGGRNEIFSETHVQNYELLRDTIISRAQGIVTDFTVVSEQRGVGGTYKVRIKARVSKRALAQTWGELQNVLNQIGRPKILVSIAERIDGRLEEQSILETKIEERLLQSGFDVVAAGAAAALRDTEVRIATAGQNTSKLQALAKDFDAHIFITGTVNADHAGIEDLYGVPAAFYNCDVQIRAYYTDTAKLLASKGIPVTRGGARGRSDFSPQAGKMAIVNVSGPLVDGLYEQILRQWATAISAGGELVLEVEGLNYKSGSRIKSMLAKMEGVEHVGFKLTRGVGTYHINAKMGAEILAERLSTGEFVNLFDIVDLKLNRIQGKVVGG